MNMTVHILGERLFTREGDDAAIDRLSSDLETLAAGSGSSGMTIATEVLRSVCKVGLPADETAGRGAMAWTTYHFVVYGHTSPGSPRQVR
jgi:hypothetical protein